MKHQIHFLFIMPLSFLFFIGCNSDSNAQIAVSEVPYSIILSGDNTLSGTFENRKIEIFRDQESLDSSLALYATFIREHTVDFSSSRVVLINMGERNTGGYSVEVDIIEDHPDYIILKAIMVKPGENCMTTPSLTSPYIFIEIESAKEILIEESLEIDDCV